MSCTAFKKKKAINQEWKKTKKDLDIGQKRRGSSDKFIENSLEQAKIQKQHFHGGAMNRVCCRRLLDFLDVIFPKVRTLAADCLEHNVNPKKISCIELESMIDGFQLLFEVIDLVFSNLCIL